MLHNIEPEAPNIIFSKVKNFRSAKPMRKITLLLFLLISTFALGNAENRALLIGIGEYDKEATGWREIHGDNDVALLQPLLRSRNFTTSTLVNKAATKRKIVNAMRVLAKECKRGDNVYLHFSCHGQPVIDCNGDENKTYDEAIVPYDAYRSEGYSKGSKPYKGENHLTDDELNPLLQDIRNRIGKEGFLFIVFDACYSKGLEKGDNSFPDDIDVDTLPEYTRGTNEFFNPSDKSYLKAIPDPKGFTEGCITTVVTACGANERNFEFKVGASYYGSLSYCISKLLRSDADFKRWTDYFLNNSYKTSGCFQKIQHPSITVYK